MIDQQSANTRRGFEARIIARAWKDPNYKQRLLNNPKAVLQQEIAAIDASVSLPAGLQVQVHEEAPNVYHLVLPRNPKDISLGELLGDNLEVVAPQTAAIAVIAVQNVINGPVVIVGPVANVVVGPVQSVVSVVVVNTVGSTVTSAIQSAALIVMA
jgi:Nitrile hydratase, alpha chain